MSGVHFMLRNCDPRQSATFSEKSVRCQSADPKIPADLRPQSAVRTPLTWTGERWGRGRRVACGRLYAGDCMEAAIVSCLRDAAQLSATQLMTYFDSACQYHRWLASHDTTSPLHFIVCTAWGRWGRRDNHACFASRVYSAVYRILHLVLPLPPTLPAMFCWQPPLHRQFR